MQNLISIDKKTITPRLKTITRFPVNQILCQIHKKTIKYKRNDFPILFQKITPNNKYPNLTAAKQQVTPTIKHITPKPIPALHNRPPILTPGLQQTTPN